MDVSLDVFVLLLCALSFGPKGVQGTEWTFICRYVSRKKIKAMKKSQT